MLHLGPDVLSWRKGWDSNPRTTVCRQRFSRPLHSTTLPPFHWSRCGDLNPKPADYKSAALPLSHTGIYQGKENYPLVPSKEVTPLYQIPILGYTPHPRAAFHGSVTDADALCFVQLQKSLHTQLLSYCRMCKIRSVFFAKNYGRSDSGRNLSSSFMALSFDS